MNIELAEEVGVPEPKSKCPRCGDLFYDPKVMLDCEKQRAAEWEVYAKRAEFRLNLAVIGLTSIANSTPGPDELFELENKRIAQETLLRIQRKIGGVYGD